jgi:hypothetical protein
MLGYALGYDTGSDEGATDGEEEQQNIPTYGCPMSEQLCAQVLYLIHDCLLLQ